MKRILIIAATFTIIGAASCKKDEQPQVNEGNKKVEFIIDETVTRSVEGKISFAEGDNIGIVSNGLALDMNNATYTVTADGKLSGGSFYYDGNKSASFYAHYPTKATYADGKVTMSVAADQNSADYFAANDFMTATTSGDANTNNGVVALKFYHQFTLVKIVWNNEKAPIATTLDNIKPTLTWQHSDNTFSASGEVIEISTWKPGETSVYWALVPAQMITTGTELVTIKCADKTYSYTTTSDVEFKANSVKTVTLSVAADDAVQATFSELTIEEWENDTVDGGGNVTEVVLPPVQLVTLTESQNITLTPNTKANAAPGQWNVAVDNVNNDDPANGNVIEFKDGALHINIKAFETEAGNLKTAKSKWWNNAVYFRPSEELASKIMPTLYKLTFKASTSAAGRGFMVQVMKLRPSQRRRWI